MKHLFIPFGSLLFSVLFSLNSYSQGCVAIRPMSCSSTNANSLNILEKGALQFSTNYQYFKSFRHFRGSHQEKERIENNTQVENFSHSFELRVEYGVTSRLSASISIPYLSYSRTSLYEHYGNSLDRNPDQLRFETNSNGLGDIRINTNFWLFDPLNSDSKGNIALGLGIKLPTGNENVQGNFHKRSSIDQDSIVTKAVDQSIQLGDGGFGIIFQYQAMRKLFKGTLFYSNGFYMSNPMTENTTLARGTLINVNPIIAYHSIPDQFAIRAGLNQTVSKIHGLSFSIGARFEGVPSHDLIGSSNGYRRPGHVLSAEPGISYSHKALNFGLSVPTAVYRNRVKSVYDLSDPSGERHGDAAFADYLVNFTFSYRIHPTKKNSHQPMND